MSEIFINQYELIQGSRSVVLDFLEKTVGPEIITPVSAYRAKTIASMLVHVNNVYFQWIGNFGLQQQIELFDDYSITQIQMIRSMFEEADSLVEIFLEKYGDHPDHTLAGMLADRGRIDTDVLSVFTHVITHEFHHKGQIMSMARLLGHTPPDADVLRF